MEQDGGRHPEPRREPEYPEAHPDRTRPTRFRRLRMRKPITLRHYYELLDLIKEVRRKDNQAIGRLFERVGKLEDRLGPVLERPELLTLGRISDELAEIRAEALEYYQAKRVWHAFMEDVASSSTMIATSAMDAAAELESAGEPDDQDDDVS